MTCPDVELQPITTFVVFLDGIGGLASKCSKGRQGLEVEKWLRPLAENCFFPSSVAKGEDKETKTI